MSNYLVEPAKSGRSTCKGKCKNLIAKDRLRFGSISQHNGYCYWRCLNCVTPAQLRNVENSVGSLQNVDGFDGLTTSQQNQFIEAWNFEAKSPSTEPKKKAIKKKKATAKAKKKKKAPKKKATKKKKAPAKAKKKKKASKKKKAPAKAKKKKAPSTSWGSKVANAIASLKSRGGSSLPAIKKALNAEKKKWRFINAALKNGVAKGDIIKKGGKYKLGKK